MTFIVTVLLPSPFLTDVNGVHGQSKDGQCLPHAHLVGKNASPSLVGLGVLFPPGIGDPVTIPGVAESVRYWATNGGLGNARPTLPFRLLEHPASIACTCH